MGTPKKKLTFNQLDKRLSKKSSERLTFIESNRELKYELEDKSIEIINAHFTDLLNNYPGEANLKLNFDDFDVNFLRDDTSVPTKSGKEMNDLLITHKGLIYTFNKNHLGNSLFTLVRLHKPTYDVIELVVNSLGLIEERIDDSARRAIMKSIDRENELLAESKRQLEFLQNFTGMMNPPEEGSSTFHDF